MDPGDGTGVYGDFPADVLANVLLRLPANTRRLLRLVCRYWRDVIGTRTATKLRSRAKTLVSATGYAYVVNNLSPRTGRPRRRELWTGVAARLYEAMNIVGTCNGLVCLCDNDGAITVANPVTGEALSVPPLPTPTPRRKCYSRSWHEGYGFAYLPNTRRYKVVHVPCCVNGAVFDTAQVITLGEASWRDVPPAGPTACNGYGVVSVDGLVYWTTSSEHAAEKVVMSLSLDDEHVAPITPLPSVLSDDSKKKNVDGWLLAEVRGRLAIVVGHIWSAEVWAMERARPGREEQVRWSRWYTVQLCTPTHRRCLTWPLFVHGEHVLAWVPGFYPEGCVLYRHTLVQDERREGSGVVVDINDTARWSVLDIYIDVTSYLSYRRVFAYVKTKERFPSKKKRPRNG